MLEKISPEAKLAIIVSAVLACFCVGPVIMGLIVLLVLGAYGAPWPTIAWIFTLIMMTAAWLVLWKRMKSDFLLILDCVSVIFMLAALTSQFSSDSLLAANYAVGIYFSSLLLIISHFLLALFVVLGINPQHPERVLKPA